MLHDSPRRTPRILAVDDDPLVVRALERVFDEQYSLVTAATGQLGLELFHQQRPDVLIVDRVLPDISGLDVLRQVRASDLHLPVLVIASENTMIAAMEAMKGGAFDYLPKPLDWPRLEKQVARALEVRRLTRIPAERLGSEKTDQPAECLLGNSPPMQAVWKAIGRATAHDGPVLLLGEPGTGKELVARTLHLHGSRAGGPLAVLNCSGLSEESLESDLFGHEAGAIPGVAGQRIGKVEQAAGGTLLIEEVGALPPALQSRLARLLSERPFERMGSDQPLAADLNIIATSSQPLGPLTRQRAFRSDLYYLLSTFTIHLPPLCERRDDIPLLVDHFVKRQAHIGRTFDSTVARVSADALALLTAYDWPGNIDELQSVVRRALAETGGAIVACELLKRMLGVRRGGEAGAIAKPEMGLNSLWISPAQNTHESSPWRSFVAERLSAGSNSLYADAIDEMDRQVMQAALDHTGGNQAQAAKILGITRGHLRKKIRTLGLSLSRGANGAAASAF